MIRFLLKLFDNWLYKFLTNNVKTMPIRLTKMIACYYGDARIRKLYWEKMGVKFGEGTFANLEFNVISDEIENINVVIGKNVSIARNCTLIVDSSPNNSTLLCNNEYVKNNLIKKGFITIEDDVWLGANVTILPNVTLKKGSIIGAGSVVTKDTEEFSIYAGIPAKKIRTIKEN